MLLSLYRQLLRLPAFKGKSRLIGLFRSASFAPRVRKIIFGLLMDLDPIEWTQSEILRDGCLEPLTTTLYGQLLRRGDSYVDVGAHVGFHTLVARHFVGETGQVIAIEPQPYNCHKILSNWQVNNFENLSLCVAAVGDTETTVALHQQKAFGTTRLSLCLEGVNDDAQIFRVPLRRLDTIFEELRVSHVRLLKIDVEGYELEAINGIGYYGEAIDNIVLEMLQTTSELKRKSLLLTEMLSGFGYKLKTVEGQDWDCQSPLPENNLWASRV
jgi:FkbM family methyltransferase